MKRTPKSIYEEVMEEEILRLDTIIKDTHMTINDAQRLQEICSKLLSKAEELRISRDKWRSRAFLAESKVNNK